MTTNNKCDHTEAIAKEFYAIYAKVQRPGCYKWDELISSQKKGFIAVAEQAIPVIAKHALNDAKDYLGVQMASESGLKKVLLWLAAAAVGGLATFGLSGCGHNVTVTPVQTEICKDGACLVIDRDSQSITYRQDPGIPPEQPVIVQKGK